MPFTLPVSDTRTDTIGPLPDPCSERWVQALDAGVARAAAQWEPYRSCLGYYVHGELPWEEGLNLPAAARALPGTQAAKRALIDLLRAHYPDAAAATTAWGLLRCGLGQPCRIPSSSDRRAQQRQGRQAAH